MGKHFDIGYFKDCLIAKETNPHQQIIKDLRDIDKYDLDEIDVVSGGDRDPESDGVDGISATQLREAAIEGDLDSFRLGIPDDLSLEDSKNLFLDLVDGLVD